METKYSEEDKVQGGFNRVDRNIPDITVSEELDDSDMGDFENDAKEGNVPFSHYKGSLENVNETADEENKTGNDNSAKVNHGVLKSGTKMDTLSEGGLPGSRKVSFHSDVGSQPNSRKVSAHNEDGVRQEAHMYMPPFLHPAYSGIPFAPNFRKISAMYGGGGSRKTSMEAFYCPQPMMPRYSQAHGKVSVFSIGNASDTGTIEGDAAESIPQLGHYRFSVFDNQRPTLYELRQEEEVCCL